MELGEVRRDNDDRVAENNNHVAEVMVGPSQAHLHLGEVDQNTQEVGEGIPFHGIQSETTITSTKRQVNVTSFIIRHIQDE